MKVGANVLFEAEMWPVVHLRGSWNCIMLLSSQHYLSDPNTLNLPLNVAGLGDNEYVAFIQHIAVPVVNDFKPSLIIVSSGFDAAFGYWIFFFWKTIGEK